LTDWRDQMFIDHPDRFAAIADARTIPPGFAAFIIGVSAATQRDRCLDLACGTGRFLPILHRTFSTCVGFDYSAPLLRLAEKRVSGLDKISLVQGDMRKLQAHFAANSFSTIVRPYTSLGYFDNATEASILRQCAALAQPGASLIYDTFNWRWIAQAGSLERQVQLPHFTLHESYRASADRTIKCRWTYAGQGETTEIDFDLAGHDPPSAEALMAENGWGSARFFSDYDLGTEVGADTTSERIVIVATRRGQISPAA
jgi:SAM-dependent methyltransferase